VTDYASSTATATISVLPATPTITWSNPASITYGTPLGTAQLDATVNVPGSFTYSPAVGSVLKPGRDQTLSVSFLPTDSTDYTGASATVSLNVLPATPVITWADPASIVYGTALGNTQLGATASVPGTFTYSPPAGTVLHAGNGQTLSVRFTPTDMADYSPATATARINVMQGTPAVAWADPADIAAGTPLGAAQLDATASVPGTFAYTPPAGTILNAGASQALVVTFTPADSTDYRTVTSVVHINVNRPSPAPPHITGILSVSRTRQRLTAMTVGFDEALDGGAVGNQALYSVLGAVTKRRKTVYTRGVGIKGIRLVGSSKVTINLARPYKGAVKLTIHGGILAANGASSSDDFTAIVG
jgi:hypothetical protein